MRYFLLILSTIALISVISVSLIFGYKTFIDMNNKTKTLNLIKLPKIDSKQMIKIKKKSLLNEMKRATIQIQKILQLHNLIQIIT